MKNKLRILIVSYYWPPSGGSGVQRWLKFTKFLDKAGHDIHVVTPLNPAFELKDETLQKDISSNISVHKLPIWEPTMLFGKKKRKELSSNKLGDDNFGITKRLTSWIRGNLLIPDGRLFWVRPATKYILRLLSQNSFDAIITTGPPHSMHLIGLNIKKNRNLKWIADFRDSWSQIDFLKEFGTTEYAMSRHRKLEQKVFHNADVVATVNDKTAELLNNLTKRRIEILYNGFDPDDFQNQNTNDKNDKFIVSHFGLLNRVRYPELLIEALEELCNEDQNFKDRLLLQFGGVVEDFILERIKSSPYLADNFNFLGYVSHKEVIHKYQQSSVLLLLLNNTPLGKTIMTGKIYEYLASQKPILGIGSKDSEPAKLIKETSTGQFFEYSEKLQVKKYLSELFYSTYQWSPKISDIEVYSRKTNADKLVQFIS